MCQSSTDTRSPVIVSLDGLRSSCGAALCVHSTSRSRRALVPKQPGHVPSMCICVSLAVYVAKVNVIVVDSVII